MHKKSAAIEGHFGENGFTLIELMVVLVILGILAGLIVPRIMGRPDEAKQLKARIQIESIETALKLYKLDNGRAWRRSSFSPTRGRKLRTGVRGGISRRGKSPKTHGVMSSSI